MISGQISIPATGTVYCSIRKILKLRRLTRHTNSHTNLQELMPIYDRYCYTAIRMCSNAQLNGVRINEIISVNHAIQPSAYHKAILPLFVSAVNVEPEPCVSSGDAILAKMVNQRCEHSYSLSNRGSAKSHSASKPPSFAD